ncbi:hypothetical protein HZ326_16460 [Fusarium oxysporum f. sp. albedinis]|nr:hypothetical protein HZ326_16460 [Fusarium oxysporum f. sp. albedinis]
MPSRFAIFIRQCEELRGQQKSSQVPSICQSRVGTISSDGADSMVTVSNKDHTRLLKSLSSLSNLRIALLSRCIAVALHPGVHVHLRQQLKLASLQPYLKPR